MFDLLHDILNFFAPGESDEYAARQPKRKSFAERLFNCGCVVAVIFFTLGVVWFAFNANALIDSITGSLP